MKTKGQVTIFIIVAILLVALALSYFIFRDSIKQNTLPSEFSEVQVFVQDCVDSVSENAVLYSGQKGGIYGPNETTSEGISKYILDSQDKYFPHISMVEEDLALEFNDLFLTCLNNFSGFEDLSIETGLLETEVFIENEKVYFEINYPIIISKGEKEIVLDEFKTKVSLDYFNFYSAVEEFMINQRTSSGICLTCLFDVGERYDVEIDMLDSGDSRTTIFMFYDEEIKLNDEVFEFRFANEV
ncbi:hypothetical protein HOD29_01715 [archaeon]|jgi:hypothetical protein|nr:hypothetical protein [archaeon]